jgi:hypothetical protein
MGNVTSLGIGDGEMKIRGVKEPGNLNIVHYIYKSPLLDAVLN